MLSILCALFLSTSFAQEAPAPDPSADPAAPPAAPAAPATTRSFLMEANVRSRYVSLPASILDAWFFRHEGEPFERPRVRGFDLGLEWVIKSEEANGIFYVEYLATTIKSGYWDDIEEPANYLDGSYLVPNKLGFVIIGGNYAYELHANEWLSFLFSTGLGLSFKTGNLIEWEPGDADTTNPDNVDVNCGPTSPAYDRYTQSCEADGNIRLPPVLPILDISLGARFVIAEQAAIRVEGGIHPLPYVGTAVGVVF